MKKSIRNAKVLITVLLALAVVPVFMLFKADAAEMTPVAAHGQLQVSGTKIVDEKGNPFQLRGISTHGINWDVGKPYVNQEAFQTLRDEWGANAVRLAMYTAEYNGYCSGGNQTELKNLLYSGVEYAKNLGMYVIIDWHILNDNNPNQNVEQAKSFFAEVSAKYQDYNNVLYEICNEPNGCSWDEIKNYANIIIPIIRANDPDAIIIVGTPTWSQLGQWGHTNEVADSPLTGYSNIVYTLHFYCAEASHTQYLPAKVDYAVSKGIPVLVSEFGMSAASGDGSIDTTQASAWLKQLDSYGIGYFCWSLSNKNESSALIANWCTKTSGWSDSELTDAGRFIKAAYLERKEDFGGSTTDNVQVENFVKRLYTLVLGRAGEESGIESWKNSLLDHSSSGVDAGYGFVFSEECIKRNLSDEDFVEMLYVTFMDRPSDEDGKNAWVSQLKAGVEREKILEGFIMSLEFAEICNEFGIQVGNVESVLAFDEALKHYRNQNAGVTMFVARCYTEALGREYDPVGLEDWCREIIQGNNTPKGVAQSFIFSDEFTGKNLNHEEYVKVLYWTFLGREADSEGLFKWTGILDSGEEDRAKVLEGFSDSDEFIEIMSGFGLQ